jgi:TolB-like protein
VLLLTAMVFHLSWHPAWADDRPPRIWILPFDNVRADRSVEYLKEALPGLLAVALSGSDRHVVVDRQHVNQVLAELSLTLEGLAAPRARREVGRLLGATVMIGGSFVTQGPDLLITVRASDVETGIVTATADGRGPAGQLGRLVSGLYRRLTRDASPRLPDLRADQIDEAPLANLHFMRGLGYYHSARYNQALAEFAQSAREASLTEVSRLWLANAYLAQGQFDDAYLELSRLKPAGRDSRKAEVDAKMRACEGHLGAEAVASIRDLAASLAPGKE